MDTRTRRLILTAGRALGLSALILLPAAASGQTAPLQWNTVPWFSDSGPVQAGAAAGAAGEVVYTTRVYIPRAPWLRLYFEDVQLAGRIEEGNGAYLRITSLLDGYFQILDSRSIQEWSLSSAYFNGDLLKVELIAFPSTPPSRVVIREAAAGIAQPGQTRSLCGVDDRILSSDARAARHLPEGCTTWLFNDTNRMFLTAGHCGVSSGDVQQFNVPLSTATGGLVNPPPEHQYAVDPASVRSNGGQGIGNDYCYFGVSVNSNTGLTPFQRQGEHHTIATSVASVAGQSTRITGYGTVSSPVSPTWNQVQKTHAGPRVNPTTGAAGTTVSYQTDTTGGNSGSPVLDEVTNRSIGIHTHAGCSATAGNNGTMITHPTLVSWLSAPQGVCRSGAGTPGGDLYAIGDGANNFGTLSTTGGNFARISTAPPRMEGLAYNRNAGIFYAVSNDTWGVAPGPAGRKLWSIQPSTGEVTYIANISGAPGVINGLGYDAAANVLYGVIQATGTRVVIDAGTGLATTDGVANTGTTIGGAEFNDADGFLYGVDDSAGASKLVRFTPATGSVQVIGPLGAGISDCNGLAITASGEFYTINATTRALLRIDPATGAATVVGPTNGIFGASYGLAAVLPPLVCYANCDGSTEPPLLTILDLACFLNRFAAGDPYANCDGSTTPPVLNVLDFNCFLNKFAAGCP
jgi:hypothetical protein